MISQTAQYALRTVLHIAAHGDTDTPVRAAALAGALGLPANYLAKTLHQLARDGVLESTRGRTGGFRLARPPQEIALLTVVAPFDQIGQRSICLLGRAQCSDRAPCPAHHRWKEAQQGLLHFFQNTTVADLLADSGLRRSLRGSVGSG